MPERVYREVSPGFGDVPCDTWKGMTAEGIRAVLTNLAVDVTPAAASRMNIRELVSHAQLPQPTEEERALVQEVAPEYLEVLDRFER